MEEKVKKVGPFKTKTKFVEFIGGKGVVNFLSDEAYITGNQLSGLEMDGIKFKLTICEDFTVDLEEVDTNQTTPTQRARLVEIIEEKTISSFRGRSVVHELNFESTKKVKDKYVPLYLAVEVSKPIERLADFLDTTIIPTKNAWDNLELLFADEEDFTESVTDIQEFVETSVEDNNVIDTTSFIEDQFKTLKVEKLNELRKNLDKKKSELTKFDYQLESTKQNIENLKSEIKLIEDRIDDIQPIAPPNGYYFNVSERQNETITLEPEIERIIKEKVSKVRGINAENFMKLFTDGEFHIKLGEITNEEMTILSDYKSLTESVWSSLNGLNISIEEDKLIYRGDLTWSQLVNKLIKMGFEENPDFNKMCGSNSYVSNTETVG